MRLIKAIWKSTCMVWEDMTGVGKFLILLMFLLIMFLYFSN